MHNGVAIGEVEAQAFDAYLIPGVKNRHGMPRE
jgi:hypothetical protein